MEEELKDLGTFRVRSGAQVEIQGVFVSSKDEYRRYFQRGILDIVSALDGTSPTMHNSPYDMSGPRSMRIRVLMPVLKVVEYTAVSSIPTPYEEGYSSDKKVSSDNINQTNKTLLLWAYTKTY